MPKVFPLHKVIVAQLPHTCKARIDLFVFTYAQYVTHRGYVMRLKPLLFVFNYLLISFTFLNTKQRTVSSAGVEKCRWVRITVMYLNDGGSHANGKLALMGIPICIQMKNFTWTWIFRMLLSCDCSLLYVQALWLNKRHLWWLVNTGARNGLLSSGNNPL